MAQSPQASIVVRAGRPAADGTVFYSAQLFVDGTPDGRPMLAHPVVDVVLDRLAGIANAVAGNRVTVSQDGERATAGPRALHFLTPTTQPGAILASAQRPSTTRK